MTYGSPCREARPEREWGFPSGLGPGECGVGDLMELVSQLVGSMGGGGDLLTWRPGISWTRSSVRPPPASLALASRDGVASFRTAQHVSLCAEPERYSGPGNGESTAPRVPHPLRPRDKEKAVGRVYEYNYSRERSAETKAPGRPVVCRAPASARWRRGGVRSKRAVRSPFSFQPGGPATDPVATFDRSSLPPLTTRETRERKSR
jgi:hypothetical protein